MPILAAEPDVFPPDLLAAPPAAGRRWWLAHTKPRQEKALARRLLADAVPYYLPCLPRRTRVRNAIREARVPLFAGYLFVQADPAERAAVFATDRVVQLYPVADADRLAADLRQVARALDLGRPVTAADDLPAGARVTVRVGPLAGLTGTVVRAAGGDKFVISVDVLRRGVAVTVDADTLGVQP